jgi:hypothetical protein
MLCEEFVDASLNAGTGQPDDCEKAYVMVASADAGLPTS